ncbi:hypothetical protein [Bacillus sp. NEB1478]|uniref:hypothetical protein n=1 Tax=Bacillus sp. NEB1478 TaxID=3073816 RepID=UPI0028732824|nr:hypothetical protein [Bacillus sp. NEB1478]WNB90841.1 hypothetical protein RGB74_13075 [Bacillus sp. NEB1478]
MRNKRLASSEVVGIVGKYGITSLPNYGEVIVFVREIYYVTGEKKFLVHLTVYTPQGEFKIAVFDDQMNGWTLYNGPIPPQFSSLPGGMGGQGWGQGQSFPSPGGQGPGSWGTWGGF